MGRHGENIRKRKDGRWEGRYKVFDEHKGRNIYRSVYGRAYREVKEKLSQVKFGIPYRKTKNQDAEPDRVQADIPKKDQETAGVVLFSQAAGEWLEEVGAKRKYSTYVKYHTVYQSHLSGIIGPCQLSAVAAEEIQAKVFAYLSEKQLSESLQKSICCIANQILDFANKKYSFCIPLLERPAIKMQKKTVWTLSKAEQAKLFCCIYHEMDKFKTAVLLCLHTGLRLGELCSLRWEDIDVKSMTLTVNRTVQRITMQGNRAKTILLETEPKSESSKRTIPLTADLTELLIQLKGRGAYVFGGEKPLDPRTMQYRFKKILKEAEVDQRNFHLLRHPNVKHKTKIFSSFFDFFIVRFYPMPA